MARRTSTSHLLAVGLLLAGCAGPRLEPGIGAEQDYLRAERLVEKHQYFQAVQALETFRSEHPGSDRVDDATYLLGQAHQGLGEWLLAQQEFDRLLSDYPQSEHREDAEFQKARSFHSSAHGPARDPEPTADAIEGYEAYLRHYPDGVHQEEAESLLRECKDRLARKACLNAETYDQLKRPEAARTYYLKSLAILDDSSVFGSALLGLGRAEERLGHLESAREAYQTLIDRATPERLAANSKLREWLSEAEARLAGLQTGATAQ